MFRPLLSSLGIHAVAVAGVAGWIFFGAPAQRQPVPLLDFAAAGRTVVTVDPVLEPKAPVRPVPAEARLRPEPDEGFLDARPVFQASASLTLDLSAFHPDPPPQPKTVVMATVPAAPAQAVREIEPLVEERPETVESARIVSAEVDPRESPPPRYPRSARRNGWEGVVRVWVRIAADGRALEIRLSASSGHEVLDEAALGAVKDWRFRPARAGAVAVEGELVVPVRFRLDA